MVNIVKHKWVFFTISIVLSIISIISLIFRGFNLDTDFAGGIALTYEIAGDFTTADVEQIVNGSLDGRTASSVQKSGNEVIIKIGYENGLTDEERNTYSNETRDAVTQALEAQYGAPVTDAASTDATATETTDTAAATDATTADTADATTEDAATADTAEATTEDAATADTTEATTEDAAAADTDAAATTDETTATDTTADASADLLSGARLKSMDVISPSSGQELARSALWMSLLACAGILIYVTIRFEFTSGCVAIIALIHDILLLLGLYSLLQWSVNINFIAAVLTVLGYSINNTIVIMDRIRENTRHSRKETYAEIANTSILQTMTRSINTTVTTLLTIGMVYILGVQSIQAFALPIIIGIVFGFYSSVFISGPLWATWRDSAVTAKRNNAAANSKNAKGGKKK